MTRIIFHHDDQLLPRGISGTVPIHLYGSSPPFQGSASIGGAVIRPIKRLGVRVHGRAFDFLSIAMAVTAADTFIDRQGSADGWSRQLSLKIPLVDPMPWINAVPLLQKALGFLSGDTWVIELVSGGYSPPKPQRSGSRTKLVGCDSVSLFSGGLDSAIGALDLLAEGKNPVLISHSYRGDADRQEIIQSYLPLAVSRFSAIANPVSKLDLPNDVQMRTRSFNFLAYGALVAATMSEHHIANSPVELFVPENGLIALNPPLTHRRIGSLSTRTTHPYFLDLMQRIFDIVQIPVHISNPYALKSKGEMMMSCADRVNLEKLAEHTVSCGKWKRTNQQCGKCVPCIIRRASFHAAGMNDITDYRFDLRTVPTGQQGRDDLLAMILAARRLQNGISLSKWVLSAGPLPLERHKRDSLLDVANRGMLEVTSYLNYLGLLS